MNTRREFLKATTLMTLNGKQVVSDKSALCEFYADKLRGALEELHGGQWDVTINHAGMSVFGRKYAK